MKKDYFKYFDPEYLAKFSSLRIASKILLDGYMLGVHQSPLHGFSSEFSEHKAYTPGDPVKNLDWKVYARTDKLYIRQFEDETNVFASIFIDNSSSMYFCSSKSKISKIDYSRMLSGALIHLFINSNDSVSLGTFGKNLKEYLPFGSSESHLRNLFKLLSVETEYEEEKTLDAYSNIFLTLNRSGFTIIFSDFLDNIEAIFEKILSIKSKKQDILLFMIADPCEGEINDSGSIRYLDSESAEEVEIYGKDIQKEYARSYQEHIRKTEELCNLYNISFIFTTTDRPFYLPLKEILEKRK